MTMFIRWQMALADGGYNEAFSVAACAHIQALERAEFKLFRLEEMKLFLLGA